MSGGRNGIGFGHRSSPGPAIAALVCLFFAVCLRIGFSGTPLVADLARDLLIAMDCVKGAGCHIQGANSSFAGLLQGAGWNHFLTILIASGLSIDGVVTVLFCLHGLSCFVIYLLGNRVLGIVGGGLAMASWMAGSLFLSGYPDIFCYAALFLPLALFFYFLEQVSCGGKFRHVAAAVVSLWICSEIHIICYVLFPILLFVVVARAERLPGSTVMVFIGFVLLAGISSTGALVTNARVMWSTGYAFPGLLILVIALSAGLFFRRVRPPPDWAPQQGVTSIFASIAGLACLLAFSMVFRRQVFGRYVLMFLPGVVLVLPVVFRKISLLMDRRWPRLGHGIVPAVSVVAVFACLAWSLGFTFRDGRSSGNLTVGMVDAVYSELRKSGYEYGNLLTDLHGRDSINLLQFIGIHSGYPGTAYAPDAGRDVFFAAVGPEIAGFEDTSNPEHYRVMRFKDANRFVWWTEEPLISWRGVKVCFSSAGPRRDSSRCETVDFGSGLRAGPDSYEKRAFIAPLMGSRLINDVNRERLAGRLTLEIPVEARPGSQPVALKFYGDWRAEAVTGPESNVLLLQNVVVIGTGGVYTLTLSKDADFGNGGSALLYLPEWIQFPAADLPVISRTWAHQEL